MRQTINAALARPDRCIIVRRVGRVVRSMDIRVFKGYKDLNDRAARESRARRRGF